MKRIKTIHPRLIVGRTEYVFIAVDGKYFEGDVPDEVYDIFMAAKRHPDEFRPADVQPPKEAPVPLLEPEPEDTLEKKEKKVKK
jgi:hypothetical protein